MCGVKDLSVKLRQRLFGHVKRAVGCVLGEVGQARHPVGGRRKKWSECVMEDLNLSLLGVEEHVAHDR